MTRRPGERDPCSQWPPPARKKPSPFQTDRTRQHHQPRARSDSGRQGFILPMVLVVVAILSAATLSLTGTGAEATRLAAIAEHRARLRAALDGQVLAFAHQRFTREFEPQAGQAANMANVVVDDMTIGLEFIAEAARMSLNAYEEADILRRLGQIIEQPEIAEDLGRRFILARRQPRPIAHPLQLLSECEAVGSLGAVFNRQFSALRPIGSRITLAGPQTTDPFTGQTVSRTWLPEVYTLTARATSPLATLRIDVRLVPLDIYPSFEMISKFMVTGHFGEICK